MVPHRIRQAFQVDAMFELAVGLVFMGNPLLGPDVGVGSGLVSLFGFVLLLAAIFLGGAALGKGPVADRLPLVAGVNVGSGVVLAAYATTRSLTASARGFVAVIAAGLVALAVLQFRAVRRPEDAARKRRATPEELRAAITGQGRE